MAVPNDKMEYRRLGRSGIKVSDVIPMITADVKAEIEAAVA